MHEQWYLEFIEHYRDDIIKNWEITTVTIPTSSSSQKYNIQQQYTNQSLLSWMHHSISDSPTASHIIFTHSPKSPRGEIQPLAFSFPKIIHGEVQPNCLAFPKQTLLDLLKLWKLPPQYLHLRIRGSASGAFSRILKRNAETKRIESISFIIRVPHSVETGIKAIWSIVYTWTARTTSNKAVIDGLSPPTQSLILRFLTCSPNQASHPLSISQIIFECLVHNYTSHRNVLEQDLWKVEYTLGLTRGTQTNDSVWNQDNGFFREFTRDCNVLLTNLVYLERRLNFTSSLGHFILSSLSSLTNGDILKEDLRYTDEEIRQAVENDLSLLKNQTHQIHSLTQRTKNLLSVLNSVVTQLDSKTNTTIARETKRDSSSMITIAFITTLFLPGTFVSSLFGTNFFDFLSSASPGTTIADEFWIYWIITIPLTVITMVSWQVWMRWPLGGRSIRSVGRSHRGADSGSRIEAVGGSHMGDRGDNGTGTYTGYKTEIEAIDPEQQESTMDFQRVGVKRWMSG